MTAPGGDPPSAPEQELVARLRRGDDKAFADLVEWLGPGLLRLALTCTPNRALAEEIVQEAWVGVIEGLARFEGRSSLRTWAGRIVLNIGRSRAQREARSVSFSSQLALDDAAEPAVDPDRFLPSAHPEDPGHWASLPTDWSTIPDSRLESRETLDVIRDAIAGLPPSQRQVITLRDIDGWGSDEVCNVLDLSATNQRVLLHRARSKVRRALEDHLQIDG